jgi:hypothetical protein
MMIIRLPAQWAFDAENDDYALPLARGWLLRLSQLLKEISQRPDGQVKIVFIRLVGCSKLCVWLQATATFALTTQSLTPQGAGRWQLSYQVEQHRASFCALCAR